MGGNPPPPQAVQLIKNGAGVAKLDLPVKASLDRQKLNSTVLRIDGHRLVRRRGFAFRGRGEGNRRAGQLLFPPAEGGKGFLEQSLSGILII
jgi:hypothetical protein